MSMMFGAGGQRHWLRLPTVTAPHPDDRSKMVSLAVSEEMTYKLAAINRLTAIFQLWTHVVGELPPINNIRRLEIGLVKPSVTTLVDSVACFRGVKRPYDKEPDGASVLVYVLNPTVSIDHEPSMVCLAKAVKMPTNVALTVQVRPADALQGHEQVVQPGATQLFGIVTRIEPVPGDGGSPILPKRPNERYIQRLWT